MAIVTGTVALAPVQGVSVPAPADFTPPAGMSLSSNGRGWVLNAGESFVVAALGTVTNAANLDWTQGGYFSLTLTASTTCVITFGTGSATGPLSPSLGQLVKIRLTGAASAAITWPSTINWLGVLTSTGGTSHAAPTIAALTYDITLVCTNTGSAPTFDGTYITST